jgi:DUF4097 and DUF4098 domain-containing protein YvlB
MTNSARATQIGLVVALAACAAFAADAQKQFRYTTAPGATLNLVNDSGTVAIHPSSGRQVVIVATPHSDKIQVDSSQQGNRIQVRSHASGKPTGDQAKVDYDVQVPADLMLTVRSDDGPIHIEKLRSDMTLEGDEAEITLNDCNNAHVHVHAVKGPVTITNLSNGHVEVTSLGGDVVLNSVSGPKVTVNTTKGNIRYTGDFAGGGDYLFNTHSGAIEVTLPTSASVELSARSINGSVEQDFPMQQNLHAPFQSTPGRSFAGTSNSGASSVELRSFSGKIRVKKQ